MLGPGGSWAGFTVSFLNSQSVSFAWSFELTTGDRGMEGEGPCLGV